jgi:vacuolar protein sorting-associated protein 11
MASSRWKRFAFFDRNALNLPNDVLQDIIPFNSGSENKKISNSSTTLAAARAAQEKDDAVRLVVTTAGLPLTSRMSTIISSGSTSREQQTAAEADDLNVVNAMWSSLTACSVSPGLSANNAAAAASGGGDLLVDTTADTVVAPVRLLQKGGGGAGDDTTTTTTASSSSMDGLVLAFLTSRETPLVHCVDVTVRCNPPMLLSSLNRSSSSSDDTTSDVLMQPQQQQKRQQQPSSSFEDMDGWRGYFAPFSLSSSSSSSASEQGSATSSDSTIADIAACRVLVSTSGNTAEHAAGAAAGSSNAAEQHLALHLACLSHDGSLVVWQDPHLHLSCRRPFMIPKPQQQQQNATAATATNTIVYALPKATPPWNTTADGKPRVVSIAPGMVAVGTDTAAVLVFCYNWKSHPSAAGSRQQLLRRYLKIPPPPNEKEGLLEVVSVKLCLGKEKASVFVAYHRRAQHHPSNNNMTSAAAEMSSATAGLCCYDLPLPPAAYYTGTGTTTTTTTTLMAPLARHDLDGRYVGSDSLVDSYILGGGGGGRGGGMGSRRGGAGAGAAGSLQVTVARPDGLYTYSQTDKIGVAPIDGSKLAIALIPPPFPAADNSKKRAFIIDEGGTTSSDLHDTMTTTTAAQHNNTVGSGYALVASTDEKSGRDAVDIYDVTNKLVAFHLLLSPGHRAVRAAGVTTNATICADGSIKGGRSSALVLTSGGTLTTLTEKLTQEKVTLLVQKNLYSAAVRVAYADPSFAPASITALYRRFAEHLYRKGDFGAAMEQYIHTIGSLETSHVIFRYLDAPKIPLLVKYLERLRARSIATSVHNELLRTCYLKLNDTEAAEAIASQSTINKASLTSILSNLSNNPKEALSTICALEAEQAAEILVIHGASLARVLPKETAGVVIALCVGTYSPQALAGVSIANSIGDAKRMVEYATDDRRPKACEPYNVELFASAFIEQPKNLRLILAHCNRNKCPLSPSLRRTLLELTLMEWNQAKRTGDTELQKLRHKEAIAALTDSHCQEIGDYDALVIVQLAGYEEGELLLYERLQMTPVLLERYAKDGSEKARRQMLALAQSDPEILADVLGHFVAIASEKLTNDTRHPDGGGGEDEKQTKDGSFDDDDDSDGSSDEAEAILEDIQEALALARRHGVLPPVRIARILAGEGTGQFSTDLPSISSGTSMNKNGEVQTQHRKTVPLSVALDYVGSILEDSRKELDRLRSEVEEYNQLCNSMESEIDSLNCLVPTTAESMANRRMNIDELYTRIRSEYDNAKEMLTAKTTPREAFWRDMGQSEDSFDTIARFFAKGVIR